MSAVPINSFAIGCYVSGLLFSFVVLAVLWFVTAAPDDYEDK